MGVLGVQINLITSFWQFLAILAIKMAAFLKLELFLRPSLKTRSHDGSAHTFRSSHRFLEVGKVFLNYYFGHFYEIHKNSI